MITRLFQMPASEWRSGYWKESSKIHYFRASFHLRLPTCALRTQKVVDGSVISYGIFIFQKTRHNHFSETLSFQWDTIISVWLSANSMSVMHRHCYHHKIDNVIIFIEVHLIQRELARDSEGEGVREERREWERREGSERGEKGVRGIFKHSSHLATTMQTSLVVPLE